MNAESPILLRSRSLRFRCSALAWAVAVVVGILGDAFAERSCPHHEAGDHAAHAVEHGEHGEHGHAHGEPAGETGHGSDGHADPCLCLGSCHAGTVLALGEFPVQEIGGVLLVTSFDRIRPDAIDLPGRAPYVLPFAHGPPLIA